MLVAELTKYKEDRFVKLWSQKITENQNVTIDNSRFLLRNAKRVKKAGKWHIYTPSNAYIRSKNQRAKSIVRSKEFLDFFLPKLHAIQKVN